MVPPHFWLQVAAIFSMAASILLYVAADFGFLRPVTHPLSMLCVVIGVGLGIIWESWYCGFVRAVICLGSLLNIAAILANGGRMPVVPFEGCPAETGWRHCWADENTRLLPLCDIIDGASIGDCLIIPGAIALVAILLLRLFFENFQNFPLQN